MRVPLAASAAAAGASQLTLCNPNAGLDLLMSKALPIAGEGGVERQGVSIKEIKPGSGAEAYPGSWVTCHYRVTLVGDGTVLDDTRGPGLGSREYGQPYEFEVAAIADGAPRPADAPCCLLARGC